MDDSASSNEEMEQLTALDKKKAQRKKISCTIPVAFDEDDSGAP